ncbi:hypothetical protein V8G56_14050 [Gaetbulibacter aquiaggeris]|uniref:Peptidase M10 metallopeptidase domain-containing protein n=1 Tax=Gaetbulibacter aquiaggeris TaxID=1735373 RepID=A0ABW7MSM8_9FLAO
MKKLFNLLTLSLLLVACQEDGVTVQSNDSQASKGFDQSFIKKIEVNFDAGIQAKRGGKSNNDPVLDFMIQINAALVGQGIKLEKVEILGVDEAGRTVFFDDKGSKQIDFDWVPNDPRNNGFGAAVPYWIDNTQLGTSSGMSEQATFDAMVNSMNNWDAVACSGGLDIPFLFSSDFDIGLVQFFTGFGGSGLVITGAIAHAGILPAAFFETALGPGAGTGTLGVTFTFSYGTDIDGNGKGDTALSEIYINDGFNWQDAPNDVLFDVDNAIDFETVVLHEVGHGLSQDHFGTAFRDGGSGALHFSPAALMNAAYSVGRRDISGTDEAGYCSNWGVWPNN